MQRMSEAIAAGWYPDPDDGGESVRYWDGRDWTEHTRPAEHEPEIAAGWYPDPDDGGISHRYWDGNDWTDRTRPASRPRPTPSPTPQPTATRPATIVNPTPQTHYPVAPVHAPAAPNFAGQRYSRPPARPRKRLGFLPDWRVFTYVILIVNLIFFIWAISAGASGAGHASDCGTLSQQTCDDAAHAGAGIAVGIIIFIWAAVDVILGIVWLITRPTKRHCPVCGTNVRKGQTECVSCGYDFRTGAHPYAMHR
jgi:hypothetical protein